MKIVRRSIAAALSLCLVSSCATLLHPEQKGNSGGGLDTVPLVLDILWFIPGVIPGVIALVVDFSTGAIYVGGGKRSGRLDVGPEGEIAIHKPELEHEAHVELRLVDEYERVLAEDSATWKPGAEGDDAGAESVSVSLSEAAKNLSAEGSAAAMHLEIVVDGGEVARYPLQMQTQGLPATDDALLIPAPILAAR